MFPIGKKINYFNIKTMTTNKICGREIAYVSPVLDFLDVENEGMLCVSGELLIEDWTKDDQILGV